MFSFLAVLLAGAVTARAQFTWSGQYTTGDITQSANWGGSAPTFSGSENVNFGYFPGTQSVVLVSGSSLAVNNLTFTGVQAYTFSGTGGSPLLTVNGNISASDNVTSNSIVFDNTLSLQLGGGTHAIETGSGQTLAFNGAISENSTAKLLINDTGGTGTVVLTGDNSFSGGVELYNGTLFVGTDTAVGTGTLKLHGGTQLSPSADVTLSNKIILVGDGDGYVHNNDDDGSHNLTLTGGIFGCGGIDWCTDGALTLSSACSTFSGGVDLREGTLYLGASSTASDGSVTRGPIGTGQLTMYDGTMLSAAEEAGTITLHNAIQFDTDGGTIKVNTANGDLVLLGDITGDGELKKTGSGNLTLGGSGDFSGGVSLRCGSIYLAASSCNSDGISGPLGSGDLKMYDGTTLGVSSLAGHHIYLDNDIELDCRSDTNVTFDTSYGSLTLKGYISGEAGITVTGCHRLILTGDDDYNGGTTINEGATLQLGHGGSSGSITGDVQDDGTLSFDRCDSYTFSGTISGSGGLKIKGSGHVTLTSDNSYTGGTKIYRGYLVLGDNSEEGSGSITGNVQFLGTTDLGGGELQFNRYDDYTFCGDISGPGRVSLFGNGIVTLMGTNCYSGGTYIDSGGLADTESGGVYSANSMILVNAGTTLAVNGNETIGGLSDYSTGIGGSVNLAAETTLTINGSNISTFSGTLSGPGALAVNGTGILTLTGLNTYGGGTTIAGGTLVAGSNSALGTGTVTLSGGNLDVATGVTLSNSLNLSAGATLGGNGTIGSAVTVGPNVIVSPGNSPGNLTFASTLTFAPGGEYDWQLQSVTGGAGNSGGWDLITISSGSLNLGSLTSGSFTLKLISLNAGSTAGNVPDFNSGTPYTWTIITANGGITGFNASNITIDASNFSNLPNASAFSLSVSGNNLQLTFTPVPEPSTYALLGLGLGTMLLRLRRRRA